MDVTTIGLDIAKNVFQVHGVDGAGKVVIRRSRGQIRSVCPLFLKSIRKRCASGAKLSSIHSGP